MTNVPSEMTGIPGGSPPVAPGEGMSSLCPMLRIVDGVRPLASAMASTVVPYMAAIEERLSPRLTVWMVGVGVGILVGGGV